MKTTQLTILVAVAMAAPACTHTVVKTRTVPTYATRLVKVGEIPVATSSSARAVELDRPSTEAGKRVISMYERRRVQVGTKTETIKVKKLSWKRTAVGALIAPVTFVTYLIAGLG